MLSAKEKVLIGIHRGAIYRRLAESTRGITFGRHAGCKRCASDWR